MQRSQPATLLWNLSTRIAYCRTTVLGTVRQYTQKLGAIHCSWPLHSLTSLRAPLASAMRGIVLITVAVAARPRPTALRAALRRRGGDVVETASASCKLSPGRAEELASLNEREHAAECIKVEGEAWSGDLEQEGEIPATDKFAIPDWYLPDLDAELRNNGDVEIHVTKTPLFSQEECQHVIAMADDHANNAGGWGKIPAGRCVSRRPVV